MPIPQSRYIEITSAKGGGTPVPLRELTARLFTTNLLVPTSSTLSFSTLESVGDMFGTTSVEWMRAAFHFGFIGKQISSPRTIQFSRWTNADSVPRIYGATGGQSFSTYTPITDGSLTLTIGAETLDLTGLDFSAVTDIAGVATVLQTGIQTGTGAQFSAATVVYDAVRASFNLVGGAVAVAAISIAAGSAGTDVSGLIGWRNATALLSAGLLAEQPVDAVSNSAVYSNNFGSFAYLDALTQAQIVAVAQWTHAQNVVYQYHVPVLEADYSAISAAVNGLSGVGLTAQGPAGEFHEQFPMAILAATDFTRRNAAQNYMYQSGALTATVSTGTEANTLDNLRLNYYGLTQTAGQTRAFYQRGYLMGGATAPVDMGVFANEQWLKDSIAAGLATLLQNSPGVPASDVGRGQVVGSIQNGTIPTASLNGAISVGRTLTQEERQFVTSVTGEELAFQQIETLGYWLDANIISRTVNNVQEFIAQYTLIYARNNTIRKVEGSDILI